MLVSAKVRRSCDISKLLHSFLRNKLRNIPILCTQHFLFTFLIISLCTIECFVGTGYLDVVMMASDVIDALLL